LHEEVSILKALDHRNIIHLYDFFDESKYYYLVTELMDGGELFDRIVKKVRKVAPKYICLVGLVGLIDILQ